MSSSLRQQVVEIVRQFGLIRLPEPVVLASGQTSREFVDGKAALCRGTDLEVACRAVLEAVEGIVFDAVGGLTMGADHLAHGVAMLSGSQWFVVRKQPKGRGTDKLVEGAQVGPGTKVLLVDDAVTSGGSIRKAHDAVVATGATVVAAVTLVDRGEVASPYFKDKSIPYAALVTYRDLGIEPVGGGLVPAQSEARPEADDEAKVAAAERQRDEVEHDPERVAQEREQERERERP